MNRKLTLSSEHKAIFDQLANDDISTLMRALMQYLNNQEVVSIENPLVKMAFAALTIGVKADDKRKLTSRENGKLGGRPRKKPNLGFSDTADSSSSSPNINKIIKEEIINNEVNYLSNSTTNVVGYLNNNNILTPYNPHKEGPTIINNSCTPESPPFTSEKSEEKGIEAPPSPPKVNHTKILSHWNTAMQGKAIRPIQSIRGQRLKWLQARLNEYGEDAILQATDKAAASGFLNGENGKGWIATFDWFIRPNNFPKVLEGNYDNKNLRPVTGQDADIILRTDQMDYNKGAW